MIERARILGSNGQYTRYPLSCFLEKVRQMNLTRLDFVPCTPHFFCGYRMHEDGAALRVQLDQAGVQASVLTPPAYRCSITAPDGAQREATRAYYKSCVELAAELGCDKLVLSAEGACWDIAPALLKQNAREMLCYLQPIAAASGIQLLLAPAMGAQTPLIAQAPVLNTARCLSELLSDANLRQVAVCLDTNVMSAVGDTVQEWFDRLGDKIALVRLCDGTYHGWCAVGEGVLPMERYMQEIEAAGYLGDYSLYLPGERYIERPDVPDLKALSMMCGRDGYAEY